MTQPRISLDLMKVDAQRQFILTQDWIFSSKSLSILGPQPRVVQGPVKIDSVLMRTSGMVNASDGRTSFTEVVKSVFLPTASVLGFSIVEQQSDSFFNTLVVLQSGDVRLRIVRDRFQIFADLGSSAESDNWSDSLIVANALGLTIRPAFGGEDPQVVLPSIAAFLKSVWPRLVAMFDPGQFAESKKQLEKWKEARRKEMGIP